ncbi:hypothetical protein BDR07DRAFT_1406699 [Suillus spraguei]|nr:hypothetical protein BDR07DRAFT_1406699 [Suillus spraguei]
MSPTEAMSLTCAMILLSEAILLYSPPHCCASRSATKGCPRRTINLNSCVAGSSCPCTAHNSQSGDIATAHVASWLRMACLPILLSLCSTCAHRGPNQ